MPAAGKRKGAAAYGKASARVFKGTYLGLILLFLYAPILILIVFSFNESKTLGNWTGFTFDWYERLLRTSEITDAIVVTVTLAVLSSLAATVLGTAAAIGLHAMKSAAASSSRTSRSCRWSIPIW